MGATSEDEPAAGQRRTGRHHARLGGRSERVVRDVLSAAVAELARVGYVALRVEDVAAGAGVNKTTVYRRWPTKAALVTAALRTTDEPELPETGALRQDLFELARRTATLVCTAEGRAVARVMLAEMDHPDVVAVTRALREEKIAPWIEVIHRAVARGELPRGTDPRLMIDMIFGSIFSRLRRQEAIDDAYLRAVIELVALGAQHGGAISR